MAIGHVVFCPRKTGSFSIAKSWSSISLPVFHTHNLHHFVVFDERNSNFYNFANKNFDIFNLSQIGGVDAQVGVPPLRIQYAIEVREENRVRFLFQFFDSLKFVSSIRNPLTRRVSQFLQSVTVEQINAVMDSVYPEYERLELQCADVGQLCHFRKRMNKGSSCPIILDALDVISAGLRLLTIDQIFDLFNKHFIDKPIGEFTEFFSYMQVFTIPDFDLAQISQHGHNTITYSFCGLEARHLLVKLENLTDLAVLHELKVFTGIPNLGREHDSKLSHHLFPYTVEYVRDRLLYRHRNVRKSALRNSGSITECQIVSALGYDLI